MQLNAANLLSLSRLALAAAFPFVPNGSTQAVLIGTAGLTDMTDGWVARRFGQRTRAGEVLDPVTDKLFVLVVVATLLVRGQLEFWQMLLLLLRDFYNTGAFIILKARHATIRFKSRMSGKVVTVLQIATVLIAVLVPQWVLVALLVTTIAALIAIVDYTRTGLASLRHDSHPQ